MEYTLKKSLGQHFLKDEQVCRNIVAALQEHDLSQLLEVGPGGGALTKHLLPLANVDFKAVELDEEKVIYLKHTYPVLKDRIIHASILDVPPPFSGSFTVVGNFPYNISSQILFRMLEWKDQVPVMVGMFQKEVADRVASGPGTKDYGILSVLVQAFYDVTYLFDVPPESFNPPPKVMSGVIKLVRRAESYNIKSERALFVLVKAAFGQRRKMLRNPLKGMFDKEVLAEELFSKRAEQLSVADFAALTFRMK